MIDRQAFAAVHTALAEVPAVLLLGPRQVGKTTLARAIGEARAAEAPDRPKPLYLDLEAPADRARLAEPALYLGAHEDRLVILDGIQRLPELFPVLRGLVDTGRRGGHDTGRFLLLGTASTALMPEPSEALAGRIRRLELNPIHAGEVPADTLDSLWLRGGFPDSLSAKTESASLRWRSDFIRGYLERDIPQLGPRIPAETLRRFWTMLAHRQATLLNQAEVSRALGVDGKTVASYLELMVDLQLVRRLPPWQRPVGKRLVKSPKVFVRDSGLVHALLGLGTRDALLGHPVAGASWEGHVIESLIAAAPAGTQARFYRTASGAEIDLLVSLPEGQGTWAIEITRSLTPKLDRGFHHACEDVQPDAGYAVYPGTDRLTMAGGVEARSLKDLCTALATRS